MKNIFSSICVSSTSKDKRVKLIAEQIYEILNNRGCRVFHDTSLKRLSDSLDSKYRTKNFIVNNCDLIIAIGGDGTILNCSREYGSKGLPILGVNLGKLGFLSDIAPKNITTELIEVIEGKFLRDSRFFIKTTVGKNESFLALNEVVMHSGAIAQLIEFDLYINNNFVYRQKADGLILSSPTGSTAYSLSGGGPIVYPNIDVFTILPMFAQSLSSTSLVIDANSVIRIDIISKDSSAKLSFDSHNILSLKGRASIEVCKSEDLLTLIHPKNHDFFEGCRTKLGWSRSIVGHRE